jgi:excisionase family DNA binding protein
MISNENTHSSKDRQILLSFSVGELESIIKDCVAEAVAKALNKVTPLKSKSSEKSQWMSVAEVLEYLPQNPTRGTLYKWCRSGSIPHHRTDGQKRLRFKLSEIEHWLSLSGVKSEAEKQHEKDLAVEEFLMKKKLGVK